MGVKPTFGVQKLSVFLALFPERHSGAFSEHKIHSDYKTQPSFSFPAQVEESVVMQQQGEARQIG